MLVAGVLVLSVLPELVVLHLLALLLSFLARMNYVSIIQLTLRVMSLIPYREVRTSWVVVLWCAFLLWLIISRGFLNLLVLYLLLLWLLLLFSSCRVDELRLTI